MQHVVTTVEGTRAVWLAPHCELAVVGESFNADHLGVMVDAGQHNAGPTLVAWLIPEPYNVHDPQAVMVWVRGGRVGYLARAVAEVWQRELLALNQQYQAQVACAAEIRGVERPGVWLLVPSDAPDPLRAAAANGYSHVGTTVQIDMFQAIGELADSDPAFGAKLDAYISRRENFLAGLSPTEREVYEAGERREHEERLREDTERQRLLELDQHAREHRHAEIEADRAAGLIGTQTELGRPLGLSAVAVGRVLDKHGLRERIPTSFGGQGESLLLPRGVAAGYAVFDDYSGREYWIVARVTPLLADGVSAKAKQ